MVRCRLGRCLPFAGDAGLATAQSFRPRPYAARRGVITAARTDDEEDDAEMAEALQEWDADIEEYKKMPQDERDMTALKGGSKEYYEHLIRLSDFEGKDKKPPGRTGIMEEPFNQAELYDAALSDMPFLPWTELHYDEVGQDEDGFPKLEPKGDAKIAWKRAEAVEKRLLKRMDERENRADELANWRNDWYQKSRLPVPKESNFEKLLYGDEVPRDKWGNMIPNNQDVEDYLTAQTAGVYKLAEPESDEWKYSDYQNYMPAVSETVDGDFTAPSYLDHIKVAKDVMDKRLQGDLQGVAGIKTSRGDYVPLEMWAGRSKSQGTKPLKLSPADADRAWGKAYDLMHWQMLLENRLYEAPSVWKGEKAGLYSKDNTIKPGDKLYTHKGAAKVQEAIRYHELVRSMREDRVEKVVFEGQPFRARTAQYEERGARDNQDYVYRDGKCLVVYRDGCVKATTWNWDDPRLMSLAEKHGVAFESTLVRKVFKRDFAGISPVFGEYTTTEELEGLELESVKRWAPILGIGLLYILTTIQARQKGDADEREVIRKMELSRKRLASKEEEDLLNQTDKLVDEMLEARKAWEKEGRVWDVEEFLKEKGMDQSMELLGQTAMMRGGMDGLNSALGLDSERIQKQLADGQAKSRQVKERKAGEVVAQMGGITFKDIVGVGDAKTELLEIVDFFRRPEKFKASNARSPKGVLLCGPPGTGKTLIARATAGESGVAFFAVSASEFVEMFVGVGASRVRDLFGQARDQAPAIIFIDEIDAIGRRRSGHDQGNQERETALNQLLSEMDGFSKDEALVVMAATNRPDVLDPALVRAGRFDRRCIVAAPDKQGRIDLFNHYLDKREISPTLDAEFVKRFAGEVNGVGADIANLVNLAMLTAVQNGRTFIEKSDLRYSYDLVKYGVPLEDQFSDEREYRVALSLCGRAVLAAVQPTIEDIGYMSLTARERAPLGTIATIKSELTDAVTGNTRRKTFELMVAMYGIRAAELQKFGTSGLSSMGKDALQDIRQLATHLVYMSGGEDKDLLGPRVMARVHSGSFLGGRQSIQPGYLTARYHMEGDYRVLQYMHKAEDVAMELMGRNEPMLDAMVEVLREKRVLEKEDISEVIEKHMNPLDRERKRETRQEALADPRRMGLI